MRAMHPRVQRNYMPEEYSESRGLHSPRAMSVSPFHLIGITRFLVVLFGFCLVFLVGRFVVCVVFVVWLVFPLFAYGMHKFVVISKTVTIVMMSAAMEQKKYFHFATKELARRYEPKEESRTQRHQSSHLVLSLASLPTCCWRCTESRGKLVDKTWELEHVSLSHFLIGLVGSFFCCGCLFVFFCLLVWFVLPYMIFP